jgi:DNA gyrase subunit A
MSIKFTEGVYKRPQGEPAEGEEPVEEESGEEDASEDASEDEGKPQIRPQGRATAGVTGVRLRKDDYVVGMAIVSEETMLLVASENGLGKRTAFSNYRALRRGGRGVKTLNVTDKTGKLVNAVSVTEQDELMLMTSTGQSIRIRVSEIRETGRVAQGVKLLTLKEGEKLQDISLVIPDGEDASGEVLDAAPAEDGGDEAPAQD